MELFECNQVVLQSSLQVELLLQQMQERFQGISEQVLARNILLRKIK